MSKVLIALFAILAASCCDMSSGRIVERGMDEDSVKTISVKYNKCGRSHYRVCESHFDSLSMKTIVNGYSLRRTIHGCPNQPMCLRKSRRRRGINPYVGPRLLRRGPGRISPF